MRSGPKSLAVRALEEEEEQVKGEETADDGMNDNYDMNCAAQHWEERKLFFLVT